MYESGPGLTVVAAGATHLTMANSSNAGRAIHFATADLFVTQQKDSEPRASDWVNTYDVDNPLVDFAKFLDGESLDQEDLYVHIQNPNPTQTILALSNTSRSVLWFNLGMHHVPHTGDL